MALTRILLICESSGQPIAEKLSQDLRNSGADLVLGANAGESMEAVVALNNALQECDILLLIFMPTTPKSAWIQQAFDAAVIRSHNHIMRPPIIILAEPCQLSDLPPLWHVYHRYDAAQDYVKALRGVRHELGLITPRTAFPSYPRLATAGIIAQLLIIISMISFFVASHDPGAYTAYGFLGAVHTDNTSSLGSFTISFNVWGVAPFLAGFIIMIFVGIFAFRESTIRKQWRWSLFISPLFIGDTFIVTATGGSYSGGRLSHLVLFLLIGYLPISGVPLFFALFGPTAVRIKS